MEFMRKTAKALSAQVLCVLIVSCMADRDNVNDPGSYKYNPDTGSYGNKVISIAAISGIIPPVLGDIPVTAINENDQYTGKVTWDGGWAWSPRFGGGKAYTATITLTAKPGYTFDGVAEDFFTLNGSWNVSNSADSGVIIAVFPSTSTVTRGDSALGGRVVYILTSGDPGYVAGEQRGFIAAESDQSSGIVWISGGSTQTTSVPGGTWTGIGSGASNTDKIIAQAEIDGNNTPTSYAAGLARTCSDGGYNDWFLPSMDELREIAHYFSGSISIEYWSSSELNDSEVCSFVDLWLGWTPHQRFKNHEAGVRPVRVF